MMVVFKDLRPGMFVQDGYDKNVFIHIGEFKSRGGPYLSKEADMVQVQLIRRFDNGTFAVADINMYGPSKTFWAHHHEVSEGPLKEGLKKVIFVRGL